MLRISSIHIAAKVYVGNCVHGLEDPQFTNLIAADATELAQLIEAGISLAPHSFFALCSVEKPLATAIQQQPQNFEFAINQKRNVIWAYDLDQDIHYFYY